MLVPLSRDLQTDIPHELSLLSVTDIPLAFKSTSMPTLGCLSLWAVFHLITHMTTMNVRVRRFTQYPINTQLLYLRQEAWVIQKGWSNGRKRTQMVRHLLGSFWNHFKLWRPHHWYSDKDSSRSIKRILTRAFRFGVHPFCPALVKLKMLLYDLKRLWWGNR